MVAFGANELVLIERFKGQKLDDIWPQLAPELRRRKCFTCKHFFEESLLVDGKCPVCGEVFTQKMCPIDHNGCQHVDPMGGLEYCPVCGAGICPECGTHDILQISRVTGYLADVSGFNKGKQAEVRDRTRYNITA